MSGDNTTPVPNYLFDVVLQAENSSLGEMKSSIYIARKTLGSNKPKEFISLAEFVEFTGCTAGEMLHGLDVGMQRGSIIREIDPDSGLAAYSLASPEEFALKQR